MLAPRILFVLLFAALSPRLAEAQAPPASFQPGAWWDQQALAPLPIFGLDAPHRAGGGIAEDATSSRVAADYLRRIPVREPIAVPNDGYPLFALDVARASEHEGTATPHPEPSDPTAAPAPPARSGVVQRRTETLYYDIEGLNRMDLAAALREHGPNIHGRQFFGLTEWEMGAGYRPVEDGSGCAIDDLTVEVSVTTHLPRWSRAAAAPSSLRRAWDRFVAALDQHERGHRVLAERAAEAVRYRLLAASAPTCDRLDVIARQEMAAVMQEYERRQLAYDAETGHGRTQGAVWPPVGGHQISAR